MSSEVRSRSLHRIAGVAFRLRRFLLRLDDRFCHRDPTSRVGRSLRRLASLLRRVAPFREGRYVKSIYGPWLLERDDVTFRQCANGGYGFFFADYLAAVSEPSTFIDVGANVGLYSLVASTNPSFAAVHAFEPSSESVSHLRANLARNGAPAVVVHPVAIMDAPGRSKISVHPGHSGRSAIVRDPDTLGGASPTHEVVDVVSTEYLDAELAPSVTGPIVVKIDVEGHELPVLRAMAASVIWPSVRSIWCESSPDREWDALVAFLASEGFDEDVRIGDSRRWDSLFLRVARTRSSAAG